MSAHRWVNDPTLLCHQTRLQMKTLFARLNHSKPRMETEAGRQTDNLLMAVAYTGQWRSCTAVAHAHQDSYGVAHAHQDSRRADMKLRSLVVKVLKVHGRRKTSRST